MSSDEFSCYSAWALQSLPAGLNDPALYLACAMGTLNTSSMDNATAVAATAACTALQYGVPLLPQSPNAATCATCGRSAAGCPTSASYSAGAFYFAYSKPTIILSCTPGGDRTAQMAFRPDSTRPGGTYNLLNTTGARTDVSLAWCQLSPNRNALVLEIVLPIGLVACLCLLAGLCRGAGYGAAKAAARKRKLAAKAELKAQTEKAKEERLVLPEPNAV